MRVLVVDDDAIFRTRLTRALSARGFETHESASGDEGVELARRIKPDRAVVDLRMPGMSGLELVSQLHAINDTMKVLVLTGYGSIATAVEAVHRGAIDYLTKPVDTEQIVAAFARDDDQPSATSPAGNDTAEPVPSLARVEYEHIQRILSDCHGNISAAARKLGIHRRSLQRKLSKLPPLS